MRFNRNARRFSQPLGIVTCNDKLMQNDPGFVELSLERVGENFDLDDFVYAIRVNHTVKHVCFSGTFVRQLDPPQWRKMLESVGYLSTLEELQIWCSTIPVAAFKETLTHATRLQKVYLFRVKLTGRQSEFDDLAACLKTHPTLRDFRIGGFQTDDYVSLNSMVEALAETPKLEVVNLQITGSQVNIPFSGKALLKLVRSRSLSDLYLSRLGLDREHFAAIAEGLLQNDNLRVLDLFGNTVNNDDVILIANALVTNCGLETLVLPCPADDISVKSCAAISRALQSNKTLLTLNLPRTNLTDDGLIHIAEGLVVNTTLKRIEVGVSKTIGDKGIEALHQMLDKNYELERVVVSSALKNIKEKVEHYMRLNEVGRGTLLRDGKASREQWVEMLISVSNDLDCLFYFTTMNPSLFQFANTSGADVIITEVFQLKRRHSISDCISPLDEGVQKNSWPRRASVL